MALGGGSATPKGQTHFKNKFFFGPWGWSTTPKGHVVASATLDWPVWGGYGSTWVAGHLIVFIFYFSFLLFFFFFFFLKKKLKNILLIIYSGTCDTV
jgi:hypothetical protein